MKNCFFLIVIASFISVNSEAQDIITKRNGDDIQAKVLQISDSEIKYKKFNFLDGPTYTEKKSEILIIRYENGSKDIFPEKDKVTTAVISKQNTDDEEPFITRYHFTNNALPNRKGDHYFLLSLLGPEVHLGLSKNLTVGMMTSWLTDPMALVTKYTFYSSSNTHLSIGNLIGTGGFLLEGLFNVPYGANPQKFGGLHWLTFTQGNVDNNISLNVGYGWRDYDKLISSDSIFYTYGNGQTMHIGFNNSYENAIKGALVIGLGGKTTLSKKLSLIFDSMLFKSSDDLTVFIMPGIRTQQDRGKALQFALATLTNNGNTVPIPYVSWLRKF